MKKLFLLIFVVAVWLSPAREASSCNVCHSKNPKMVRMHQELGFKDCFTCHTKGMTKNPDERKAQMLGDKRCISCHKK